MAQKLRIEGNTEESNEHVQKVDESKLSPEFKANYYCLLAYSATKSGDRDKSIEYLESAKTADRMLSKPIQQFALTKQIALTFDTAGGLDEAIAAWEKLIDDFKDFEHSEHQPLLAHKFLSKTLIKAGYSKEAEAVKTRWVNERVEIVLKTEHNNHFKTGEAPLNYNDELTNFFERCRQNVFVLYADHPAIIEELRRRNAQFWIGSESMRDKMADLLGTRANGKKLLSAEEQLPYFFFMRSVSTYLTSVELGAAGRLQKHMGRLECA